MHMEYLHLIPGFRTALADGVMVGDSPKHMATWELYRGRPGSRIHLCREGYVFAPAVFSMEREPQYIYTYAYQPEENWTTYTGNLTPDSYTREDYVFGEDCWFRVCVRREDGQDLTEEDMGVAGELAEFYSEPIPYEEKPWMDEEVQAVIGRIREQEKPDMLKLCLLTDTHYTVNGIWEDTACSVQRVAEKAGYDAIVHLGDLTDGMMPKEITTKYVRHIMEDLKKCGVPLYITLGNHDNNYFRNRPNTFGVEEMRELYQLYGDGDDRDVLDMPGLDRFQAGMSETGVPGGSALERRQTSSGGSQGNMRESGGDILPQAETERGISYYVDMPGYSARLIFLSSFDDRAPVRYGYTDRQLVWLKNVLYGAEKGTKFLIFSHDAPLAKLDFWSFYVRNGDKLLEILEECNKRAEYQIIGFFYGHTHGDCVFEECSFPVVSVGCSKLEYMLEKKPQGCATPSREPGTRTQELWDSLLVDFKEEKIKLIRFGAGEDREVSFKKKEETYTEKAAFRRARRSPKIWAHRGESGHAPENTLPAFRLAWAMKADGIELDVQLSKDGTVVVIHDERVDRVSDGIGWVKDLTLEELKGLDVNRNVKFAAYGKGEIPTLAEVLDFAAETDMTVNIELKNNVVPYEGMEEKVLELVRERGLEERVIYSSFNHESMRRIQRLAPGARTGFLYSDGIIDAAEYGSRYGACALHPAAGKVMMEAAERDETTAANAEILPKREAESMVKVEMVPDRKGEPAPAMGRERYPRRDDLVRQCHERNLRVHVWAVNKDEDFERMEELGADAVITDFVERGEKEMRGRRR